MTLHDRRPPPPPDDNARTRSPGRNSLPSNGAGAMQEVAALALEEELEDSCGGLAASKGARPRSQRPSQTLASQQIAA
eukprot:CAMPEP_0203918258 /NCGR_PEP_ID=MMETSP0359-20131031/58792_1 /ASSEMBLY_ACC=CAM_ASM_000338 /TAXON_ID=268821 /ORGANISM="Scrippsiella Hangoei, Strain SHTV-5" /LENGTH=77 /DNA_ID=CAMNT_0050845307 /DNA_START=1127 /DNA_END=1357 /DNA_ORIENTATION=+